MGEGTISFQQFSAYFAKGNPGIDSLVLQELYSAYSESCKAEGVRLDVALAQMIHETAFLRFTGTVNASQNNFAGMGTVDARTPGLSFPDRRTGALAQVQHLKGYASTEKLKLPLVDPRFRYIRRGQAPTVLSLAGRWAADVDYGRKLMAHIQRLHAS